LGFQDLLCRVRRTFIAVAFWFVHRNVGADEWLRLHQQQVGPLNLH
jgi:hypothetical protein